MDVSDVALFCSIVSTGSLSAAGRLVDASPMAVSRRLAKLEGELGVRLVHRTTRSLALTSEGETFLPLARAMLDARDTALSAFAERPEGLGGTLRVTAPNIIGRTLVVPAVARLMAAHPLLQADVTLSDGIVDIVASGIDVAIRVAPLQVSELIAVKLADNPRTLCASPAYLEAHGHPQMLSDLDTHACLTLHGIGSWLFQRDGQQIARPINGRLSASSADALRAACLAGTGLALLTYWDVVGDLAGGELVEVPLQDADPVSLAVWAVLPSRRHMPSRVGCFIEELRSSLISRPGA
ncbi:LysR family transcriptional regulator [Shinella daejeonensis]|uniref:LysR family transcriptional regulator n=1 Tax=Shinella daejeonensis TaxID=659017 RepID=UPI0020C75001|nr:LysR family transcriptional regulator [Shinella daejeonensis]MCP8894600.1 LysR family transcriptional regulator [Shinella daejeonensis]